MIKMIDKNEIPEVRGKRNDFLKRDIQEFLESGAAACECFTKGVKCAASARQGYVYAVKRLGAPVDVVVRKNRIFLIRRNGDAE